jgi:hypothetical protein
VLASNRRFRGHAKLPAACRVFPLFRFHTYSKYTIFAGGGRKDFPDAGSLLWKQWQRLRRWVYKLRHRNGPQRRINDFSGSCRKLFTRIGLAAGDIVFVPTLSELDLAGLVTYLEQTPATREVDWHLQFHFNIFDGREPDYARQPERLSRLKAHFHSTLARVPGHRLHFYNTSDILTRQYNRLGVAPFGELAYPINEAFHQCRAPAPATGRPLRITCAGGVREEKGQAGLCGLVRELWPDCLAAGRAQLLVQAKSGRFTGRPRFEIPLPDAAAPRPQRTYLPHEECPDPVVYIRHPLGIDDYEELIRRADIGLLLYDSVRYYSRRAGILGELLAAGIPVVVPAGCWLAEQIAEPIHQHVSGVLCDSPLLSRLTVADLVWEPRASGGALDLRQGTLMLGAGRSPATCGCAVPRGASELVASFRWVSPQEAGTYLRLEAEQLDEQGAVIGRSVSIVGRRPHDQSVPTLVRLEPAAWRVRLALSNAYDEAPVTIQDVQVSLLSSAQTEAGRAPSGAVGLIAADSGEAPRLLREMIDHYDHYRRTAAKYSSDWFRRHDPRRTVSTLIDKSAPSRARRQAA